MKRALRGRQEGPKIPTAPRGRRRAELRIFSSGDTLIDNRGNVLSPIEAIDLIKAGIAECRDQAIIKKLGI